MILKWQHKCIAQTLSMHIELSTYYRALDKKNKKTYYFKRKEILYTTNI